MGVWTNHTETPIRIIYEAEPFQKRLIAARNKIFPKGAKFNEESQRELGRCLGRLVSFFICYSSSITLQYRSSIINFPLSVGERLKITAKHLQQLAAKK